MSDHWIEDFALSFEFTPEEVAKIKLAIQQTESILAIYQKCQSDLNRAKVLFEATLPTYVMAINKLKERMQ